MLRQTTVQFVHEVQHVHLLMEFLHKMQWERRYARNDRNFKNPPSLAGEKGDSLSNLENGKKEPKLRVIEMLAGGLGVPLRRIFWDL